MAHQSALQQELSNLFLVGQMCGGPKRTELACFTTPTKNIPVF